MRKARQKRLNKEEPEGILPEKNAVSLEKDRRQTWQEAERLLCVRLDAIGDLLMTTPAIRALKVCRPERQITLLTSSVGAKAAAYIPEVDEVIAYDPPWMKATEPRETPDLEFEMIERLRQGGYDAVVIFTVFSQSPFPVALLTYLADIPLRLGYARENPYQMLTDWLPDPWPEDIAAIPHEVRRLLNLVESIGCTLEDERMRLHVPVPAQTALTQWIAEKGLDLDLPWLVIHPGASAPSRRYSARSFVRVAEQLNLQYGFQIVFTGGPEEVDLVERIRQEMSAPSFSAAGEFDLGRLFALLQRAPLLISNNTGPVHMAAALGTPVVDIYALTNPQHTPWGVPHRVLNHEVECKYCFKSVCPMKHHNCLRLLTPEVVVQATVDLWRETGRGQELATVDQTVQDGPPNLNQDPEGFS